MKQHRIWTMILGGLLIFSGMACQLLSPEAAGPGIQDNEAVVEQIDALQQQLAEMEAQLAIVAGSAGLPETAVVNGNAVAVQQHLIDLYKSTNPSVVHIFTNNGGMGLGSGSGFVYDADGHIVTNNHVVEGGNNFEVVFADGSRRIATVVGMDVDSDLAVIKVNTLPAGAVPLPLGNSREIQVGQMVIAIGNPFGEQSSMSMGIISGLGRSIYSQRQAEGGGRYSLPQVIQTDAPINPGNSGGPLIDLEGRVIGVNSAIRTDTGVNSGVGFSIPVNAVRRIAPSLITKGAYTYPFMGVQIGGLNLQAQEQLNLSQTNGAYVSLVTPDSPAQRAGLIGANGPGGDLIVAINNVSINGPDDLIAYLVFETEVGQTIDVTILRDGEMVTLPLTLNERP